jgi:hypothetical protein
VSRKIYLLCGFPCSGKDTVAAYLFKMYNIWPIAFGSTLKWVCRLLRQGDFFTVANFMQQQLGITDLEKISAMLHNYKGLPIEGKKDRLLLQELGTDFRKIRDDVWINPVKLSIKDNPMRDFVITDCRRLVELDSFPDATKIYVDCNNDIIYQRLKKRDGYYDVDILTRESEVEIPSLKKLCDYVIDNSGSYTNLVAQIEGVLKGEQIKSQEGKG